MGGCKSTNGRIPYQDLVTCFLKALYIEFDFEAVQEALKEAIDVIDSDFLLGECKDEVPDNASIGLARHIAGYIGK